jgi:aspartate racemase
MSEMKTIGLIGGMSWESTAVYYKLVNEGVAARLGGFHSARLVLFSVDFHVIERAQAEARWSDAAKMLGNAGAALRRAGADFLVLCTNTMHKVAAEVEKIAELPLLHIGDVTGEAIARMGLGKVGLLGTRFTMEETFYRERLESRFGIRVEIPGREDREEVHRVIYDELCRGLVKKESRETFLRMAGRLVENGCQGVILGCTEIPMLLRQEDTPVPLFDTTRLHAEAAVERAVV